MGEKRYKSTVQRRKERLKLFYKWLCLNCSNLTFVDVLQVEADELREEVRRLQLQLDKLHPLRVVKRITSENAALSHTIRQQQLGVARAQSALTPLLGSHPLHSPIFLKKDWENRKKTLLTIREKKFRAAYDYVSMRGQGMRGDQPRLSDEREEMENGDTCSAIFQTIQLPGVKSLKQTYDAVLFALHNAEISISERLGHVTVRDDYDGVDGKIYNSRVVSTNDMGVTTELNCVMCSQLYEEPNESFGGKPCGMILLDSVDEDELYPYSPSERVRKDLSVAFVLTEDKTQNPSVSLYSSDVVAGASSDDDNLVIILQRVAFVELRYPEFHISEAAWQEVQQDTALWGEVMVKSIRSVLYSRP